jgi:hypothetical protein
VDLSGAAWRKSTYSGGNGGQCVEVATITSHPDSPETIYAVRDSKDPEGPLLVFCPGQWRRFTGQVKAGGFGLA